MSLGPVRHLNADDFDPPRPVRGYAMLYRSDTVNHCPGCGRSHWHVGRASAECAFCATAVPIHLAAPGAPPVKA